MLVDILTMTDQQINFDGIWIEIMINIDRNSNNLSRQT